MNKADRTLLRSTYEIELLKEISPEAKLVHMPIVRKIPGFNGTPFEGQQDIVFIGGYDHKPNIDAVKYFILSVLPNFRNLNFDGRLFLAGSNMPSEVKELAADDEIIKGFVENLDELFGRCKLTVAPLRYGAGVKGKVRSYPGLMDTENG